MQPHVSPRRRVSTLPPNWAVASGGPRRRIVRRCSSCNTRSGHQTQMNNKLNTQHGTEQVLRDTPEDNALLHPVGRTQVEVDVAH
jgi:hypothetical protein